MCVLPLRHKKEFRQAVYVKTLQKLEDSRSLLYFTGCSKRHCGEEEAGENVMTFCLKRLVFFQHGGVAISTHREFSWVKSLFDRVDLILYDLLVSFVALC